jgi:hypothetical protein
MREALGAWKKSHNLECARQDRGLAIQLGYHYRLLYAAYAGWRRETMTAVLSKHLEAKAVAQFARKSRARALSRWVSSLCRERRRRELGEKAAGHCVRVLLRRAWRSWFGFRTYLKRVVSDALYCSCFLLGLLLLVVFVIF